jgi:hypothetical protein
VKCGRRGRRSQPSNPRHPPDDYFGRESRHLRPHRERQIQPYRSPPEAPGPNSANSSKRTHRQHTAPPHKPRRATPAHHCRAAGSRLLTRWLHLSSQPRPIKRVNARRMRSRPHSRRLVEVRPRARRSERRHARGIVQRRPAPTHVRGTSVTSAAYPCPASDFGP